MVWIFFLPSPFLPLDSILLATLPYGKRIIANVDGGHFEGPNIKGTVQPPASDWLLIRADNSVQLDVRVSLVADDNALIYMSYQGLRAGQQSVLFVSRPERMSLPGNATCGPSANLKQQMVI